MTAGSTKHSRTVVSITRELMAATRIAATSKPLGVEVITARPDETPAILRGLEVHLVLLDLEAEPEPDRLIRALKSEPETRAVPLVCFYPHVRNALRESALAAGADQVLPRSAFFRRLPALLAGEADTPA